MDENPHLEREEIPAEYLKPPLPMRPADTSEAQEELKTGARKTIAAAQEIAQLALFGEVEFEEGLLLSPEVRRKRYTAEASKAMEWRRHACLELLAYQIPAQDIARILHMNLRTIQALAVQEAQTIASSTKQLSKVLINSAMGDIALAATKAHNASFKDLHIGAGIKLTHATTMQMGAVDGEDALEEVKEASPALQNFRAKLKQLAPPAAPAAPVAPAAADAPKGESIQ